MSEIERNVESIPHTDHGAVSASLVFSVLWNALADVLGTAAAATLLRRAGLYAEAKCADLAQLSIKREAFEYDYVVPEKWRRPGDPETLTQIQALVSHLVPLLKTLTGSVVVRRLDRVPLFRASGIVFDREDQA